MNTIGVLKKRKVDLFSANSLYTFAVLKFQDLFIPYMFDYYWKSKALEVFIEKKTTKFVQNWSVFKIYGGSYKIDLFSLPEVQETVKSKKEAFERLNSVHLKGI